MDRDYGRFGTEKVKKVEPSLRAFLTRAHNDEMTMPVHESNESAPWAVADSLFLPAVARRIAKNCFFGATLHIDVKLPPPAPPRPRLVAADIPQRQRRRKTWSDNIERYAIPEGTVVTVRVQGSDSLRRMLDASDECHQVA